MEGGNVVETHHHIEQLWLCKVVKSSVSHKVLHSLTLPPSLQLRLELSSALTSAASVADSKKARELEAQLETKTASLNKTVQLLKQV